MASYLVDTNIVSEFSRPVPNAAVFVWFDQVDPDTLSTSVIVLGELRFGLELLPVGKRRADLQNWLDSSLPGWFGNRLLPVTQTTAEIWAKLSARSRTAGTPLSTPDGLIAATALEHNLTLVTRNIDHFLGLGVVLCNPCDGLTYPAAHS